jgi:hypothetical protein
MTVKILETRSGLARVSHLVTSTSTGARQAFGDQAPALFPYLVQRPCTPQQDFGDPNRRPEADVMSAVGRSAGRPTCWASRCSTALPRHSWLRTNRKPRTAK